MKNLYFPGNKKRNNKSFKKYLILENYAILTYCPLSSKLITGVPFRKYNLKSTLN